MKKVLGIGLLLIGLGVGIYMLSRSGSGFPGDTDFRENGSGLSVPNMIGENVDAPPLPGGGGTSNPTSTLTPARRLTLTFTSSPTWMPKPSNTPTHTPVSPTPTITRTPTITPTLTLTPTLTITPTLTPTLKVLRAKILTPTATLDFSKCDWFDQEIMSLTLFDIKPGGTNLTLYVKNPPGWPGVEVEDDAEWMYTAFLGDVEAEMCSFEGYPGRLYCYFMNLPMYMMNTTQMLKVTSNHCPLIYTNERVSIIGPELTPTKSSCKSGLGRAACADAGGTYSCGAACTCQCP